MSPMPHIGDYVEKKKKSFLGWYLLSAIVGVALFFFFLLSTKGIILVVKFAIEHWVYFGIGVLVFLILIKKIKKRRRKKLQDEYSYR